VYEKHTVEAIYKWSFFNKFVFCVQLVEKVIPSMTILTIYFYFLCIINTIFFVSLYWSLVTTLNSHMLPHYRINFGETSLMKIIFLTECLPSKQEAWVSPSVLLKKEKKKKKQTFSVIHCI
jgi:hypothetical protein